MSKFLFKYFVPKFMVDLSLHVFTKHNYKAAVILAKEKQNISKFRLKKQMDFCSVVTSGLLAYSHVSKLRHIS